MRCFLFSLDLVAFIVVDHHYASKKERQAEPCLRSANRRFAFISPYTRVHLHTMPKSLCLSFYYSSLESFISWPFQKELFFLPASELCYTADNTQFSLKMLYYSNATFQIYVMIIKLTVTLFFFLFECSIFVALAVRLGFPALFEPLLEVQVSILSTLSSKTDVNEINR